jgi:hypothetical protein
MIWGAQKAAAVPAIPGGMLLLLAALLLFIGYRVGRRQRAPRWLAAAIGLGVALVPVAIVRATTTIFGVPFSFANGTTADATQVNQNFAAVTGEINVLRNQTSILTECEFHPRTSSITTACGLGNGGAYITGSGGDPTLMAVVHVPMGATITSVDIWVGDFNNSTNLKVCLAGIDDAFGGYDFASPCVSSSGSPGIGKLTVVAAGGGVVQGNGETFELFVYANDASGNLIAWPTDASLVVRSAYVHYQVP